MADLTPTLTQDPGDWGLTWADLINAPTDIIDDATKQLLIDVACTIAWHMTGRRLGKHVVDPPLRPCLRCGHENAPSCGCWFYHHLDLDSSGGERPIISVESVKAYGIELDPATEYAVRDSRWLARTPVATLWPFCQDLGAEPPPLELAWSWGLLPTKDLLYAGVGPLINQLWLAWNYKPCTINPAIVQSVQREGISFALISQGEAWRDGFTGDPTIDAAFMRAWPMGPHVQQSPGFFDPASIPDFARFERQT